MGLPLCGNVHTDAGRECSKYGADRCRQSRVIQAEVGDFGPPLAHRPTGGVAAATGRGERENGWTDWAETWCARWPWQGIGGVQVWRRSAGGKWVSGVPPWAAEGGWGVAVRSTAKSERGVCGSGTCRCRIELQIESVVDEHSERE